MLEALPSQITIGSFSLIGILTGYIWNEQNKKIKRIFEVQAKRKCDIVCSDIKSIKTDISWIKDALKNKI